MSRIEKNETQPLAIAAGVELTRRGIGGMLGYLRREWGAGASGTRRKIYQLFRLVNSARMLHARQSCAVGQLGGGGSCGFAEPEHLRCFARRSMGH